MLQPIGRIHPHLAPIAGLPLQGRFTGERRVLAQAFARKRFQEVERRSGRAFLVATQVDKAVSS